MKSARIQTGVLKGIEVAEVEVEVTVDDRGNENFQIIGLADSAVKEARERVISALGRSGIRVPKKVLINLAPADLKKEGSSCDLAMAMGIVVALGIVPKENVEHCSLYGELALDGRVKNVRGSIAFALQALESGKDCIVLPNQNLEEAAVIDELELWGVGSLVEAVSVFSGDATATQAVKRVQRKRSLNKSLSEVRGQKLAKRALSIAAAGGHNVLFIGTPGCGKSMLAERFASILPPLSRKELLSVIRMHSVAGYSIDGFLDGERPFRRPHHSISQAGLVGGGTNPRPGEISLAHHGVLFLDEFPEFKRQVIEALRAPLEGKEVQISRAKGTHSFPANFQLIAAMNPCPCGRLGVRGKQCLCSPQAIYNYIKKISQPILDRIDLHIDLKPVSIEEIKAEPTSDEQSDEELREIVTRVRENSVKKRGVSNSELSNHALLKSVVFDNQAEDLLKEFSEKKKLSARGYFRTLKIALTISEMERESKLAVRHMAEALSYRGLDVIESYISG